MRVFRKYCGKPYRDRKNFDDLDENLLVYLAKIERYVVTRNVDVRIFFELPFKDAEARGDKKAYYDLKYFTTYKAQSAYGKFRIKLKELDLDSDIVLKFLKVEMKFLLDYCNEHNMSVAQYLNSNIGVSPAFFTHINTKKLTPEFVIGLLESPQKFLENSDISAVIFGDNHQNKINTIYSRFVLSTKFKKSVKKFKEVVENR